MQSRCDEGDAVALARLCSHICKEGRKYSVGAEHCWDTCITSAYCKHTIISSNLLKWNKYILSEKTLI